VVPGFDDGYTVDDGEMFVLTLSEGRYRATMAG
jgi:hypothetical protein